jgi:putative PEP-CTERM system histidine kinase
MSVSAILSFAAAYFSLITIAAVLLRDRRSFVHRAFSAGMVLLAIEELLRGVAYGAVLPEDVIYWQKRCLAAASLTPAVWLAFSVSYARANSKLILSKWRWVLGPAAAVPVVILGVFRKDLFTGQVFLQSAARWLIPLNWPGKTLQLLILFVSVLILFNLERTIRSSTGRVRWQIKFMALGVGGLFATRTYLASQSLLFAGLDTAFGTINAFALVAANILFALSLARGRLPNVELYLSSATIRNSFTIVFAGVYLLSVGVLARFARYFSISQSLPLDALIVFIALTALAVLLLSNRLRRQLLLFVTRHFKRPAYDYRNVWMEVTQRTTSLLDVHELSSAVSKIVSESLQVLSVSVWLPDETKQRLVLAGSTALSQLHARELETAGDSAAELIRFLESHQGPVDLEAHPFEWTREVMRAAPDNFRQFSMRYAVGLHAGGGLVGVMTLNDDRVGGEDLSADDFILLETLASQLAAGLLNLKLSAQLRKAGEVEAFQTVSTFFVHDLKNLASKLSLTMENLPEHFDDPEFRADALRVISGSLRKIDTMCSRLSMLKQTVELNVAACDLKQLLASTLEEFKPNLKAALEPDLKPIPPVFIDSEQMHKVVTNLVMNANEAVNGNGVIRVATLQEGNTVGFAVRDNGCGMSEEFIETSLFRPFQTTKKKGLGIGLFHTKMIVEAHRGKIEVHSKPGEGAEFRVLLPVG